MKGFTRHRAKQAASMDSDSGASHKNRSAAPTRKGEGKATRERSTSPPALPSCYIFTQWIFSPRSR